MKKKPALGRSISALIGPENDVISGLTRRGGALIHVSVDALEPNPFQPRGEMDESALAELTESIQRNGVLQPVLVRPHPTRPVAYQLVAGHRRLEASRRAGLATIPAVVHEADDKTLLEIALIENIQRESLSPIDEALAYQVLNHEMGYTHEEIAERVGKSRVYVSNMLRLLNLPEEVQAALRKGEIQAGHARALLALTSIESMLDAFHTIVDHKLTVRQAETLTRKRPPARKSASASTAAGASALDPNLQALCEAMKRSLGTQVRILPKTAQRGVIHIEYYSLDALDGIVERLGIEL